MSIIYNGKVFRIRKGVLDLSNQKIVHIGSIHGLDDVKILNALNLSNNQISDPIGIEKLSSIKELNLSHNNINNFHGLQKLVNLEYLNISNNSISSLEGISKLTKLKTLNLSNNQISNIEELLSLKSLKKVYLQGNLIAKEEYQKELTELLGVDIERPIIKTRIRAPTGSFNLPTSVSVLMIITLWAGITFLLAMAINLAFWGVLTTNSMIDKGYWEVLFSDGLWTFLVAGFGTIIIYILVREGDFP